MKDKFIIAAISTAAFFTSTNSYAQLQVNGNSPYNTAAYLIQNVLLGTGVTASNFTYNGDPVAIGFFNGIGTNLNLDSGIIMTSGDIANAPGPNNSTSISSSNGLPGDPDLDLIMSPTLSYEACILEFDFIPTADTVKFRYVFGSDEYMEWVSTSPGGINDGFGFFLSGPGISGPYSNNSDNIALIPSTTLPVTMFNLNLNSYGQYYFDNGDGSGTGTAPDGPDIQYDGFTIPLTAKHWVQCGQTYHIKIAIGDGGDGILDSGVFLEAGSFTSAGINITANVSYGGPNDSTLFEGCGQACLYFVRSNTTTVDTVNLTIGGNAINGTDYTPNIPSQLIFPIGVDSIMFCLTAVSDNITEGLDTVNLNAIVTNSCSQNTVTNVTFYIGDHVPLVLTANNDTTVCAGQQVFLNANTTGGVQPFGYSWSTGSTNQGILVTPTTTTTYSVVVVDSCGAVSGIETVTVNIPPVLAVSVTDATVCQGSDITINGTISGGVSGFNCVWTTLFGSDTIPNICTNSYTFTPTSNGIFVFTVTDQCNVTRRDTMEIFIDSNCVVDVPNIITPNGDGQNDLLVFKHLDHFSGSALHIYNRWGASILESSDYKNNWNGDGAPDGTYYYVLAVADGKGTVYKGFIQIMSHK